MSAGGRTIWQAQDAAWWSRERVVELGEEFGPAGPAVANWLECQAKLQNDGGMVKAGYRAIARGAFLQGGAEEAERIVRLAVEIGFLKDFDEGQRTFNARVSAYAADQARGRDTLGKAGRRAADPDPSPTPPTVPDTSGQDRTEPDKSAPVLGGPAPVGTGEESTGENSSSLRSLPRARATLNQDEPPDDFPPELRAPLDEVLPVLQRIAEARGANVVTVLATARAIAAYPRRPHLQAALDLEHWLLHGTGRRNKPRDVVGYYRNQLRDRWQDQATPAAGQSRPAPQRPADARHARSAENEAALDRLMSTQSPEDAAA